MNNKSPQITIVLLSYKRPQNIPIILKSISSQTVRPVVYLWDNGEADVNGPLIDRYYKSEKNAGCMSRWRLVKQAITPYVMSMDDDICFSRNNALEDIIKALKNQDNPNRIIGFIGACLGPIPLYTKRKEYACRYKEINSHSLLKPLIHDAAVDIVKGRVMAFRRQLLDFIDLPEEREDDIYLSAMFANKARKFHCIPALLNDAFRELPGHGCGNWHQQGHFLSRDRACLKYFSAKLEEA